MLGGDFAAQAKADGDGSQLCSCSMSAAWSLSINQQSFQKPLPT
jgi:hypothetical protein